MRTFVISTLPADSVSTLEPPVGGITCTSTCVTLYITPVPIQLFFCWRRNVPSFGVNTMPADAMAPNVASASEGMVLSVEDREHILLFQSKLHHEVVINISYYHTE